MTADVRGQWLARLLPPGVAAALWLGVNPYIGIEHDAELYSLLALNWLSPEAYARDLWLAFGSQDSWSQFSPLFAIVLAALGVAPGAMVLTLVGAAMFVFASRLLAGALLRGPAAWLATLLLVSVPLCYSPRGILFVSESFATARIFAVPLSLAGLALGLRGRLGGAVLLHAAGLALHPAMALGPAAITLLGRASSTMLGALVGAGVAGMAGLLAAGAVGLLPVIDGAWRPLVEPAVLVFIAPWLREEWLEVLAPLFLLLIALRHGSPRARRLYGLAALVASLGLLASLVAAATVPVVLAMQAQFWRALWVAKVVAAVAFADLVARYLIRKHAPFRLPLLVALVPAAGLTSSAVVLPAVWLASKWLPPSAWHGYASFIGRHRVQAMAFVTLLIAVGLPGYLASLSLGATSLVPALELPDVILGFLRTGGYGVAAVLAWWALRRLPAGAVAAAAVALLTLAALLWDVRSMDQKYWESRFSTDGSRRMFAAQIRRGQTVFWRDAAPRVWFEMGTAGYAGTRHATGLVFSRERTILLQRRLERVAVSTLTEEQARTAQARGRLLEVALRGSLESTETVLPEVLASYESRRPSTAFGIRYLCADPDLDFVIDPLLVPGLQAASAAYAIGRRREVMHLYRCADVRSRAPVGELS